MGQSRSSVAAACRRGHQGRPASLSARPMKAQDMCHQRFHLHEHKHMFRKTLDTEARVPLRLSLPYPVSVQNTSAPARGQLREYRQQSLPDPKRIARLARAALEPTCPSTRTIEPCQLGHHITGCNVTLRCISFGCSCWGTQAARMITTRRDHDQVQTATYQRVHHALHRSIWEKTPVSKIGS